MKRFTTQHSIHNQDKYELLLKIILGSVFFSAKVICQFHTRRKRMRREIIIRINFNICLRSRCTRSHCNMCPVQLHHGFCHFSSNSSPVFNLLRLSNMCGVLARQLQWYPEFAKRVSVARTYPHFSDLIFQDIVKPSVVF